MTNIYDFKNVIIWVNNWAFDRPKIGDNVVSGESVCDRMPCRCQVAMIMRNINAQQ